VKSLARAGDKAELVARLRSLRPDSARRWGRMSAHQMVCHLADALQMALGQKTVEARCTFVQRTLVKWVALYAPLAWPPGIVTSRELDQEHEGTRPAEFAADVARVEALMEVLAASARTDCPPHPIFGGMSEAAWLRWGYLHADHHLRQFGA
jgi:hypothetical protein